MINNQVNSSNYIKYAWIIISKNDPSSQSISFEKFSYKYSKFIRNLIINSQLTSSNLIISLYYLYKHYHQNTVLNHSINNHDNNEINSVIVYNIIISLVLCNKCLDDQSYTLKTWLIIINNSLSNKKLINIDLKLLNYLEGFFLSSLNYELGFKSMNQAHEFWEIFDVQKKLSQPQQLQSQSPHQYIPQLQSNGQVSRKRKDIYCDYSNLSSPLSINNTPLSNTTRLVGQFYSPPPTPSYKKRRTESSQYTYMPPIQPQPQIQYNYIPPQQYSTTFNYQPQPPQQQPMVPILLTQPQPQPQPQYQYQQQRQYVYNWS